MKIERAAARDMADAGNDLGDEAVVRAFATAKPQPQLPSGFGMKNDGLYHDGGEGPERICGKINIVAQTRDKNSQSWGLLLRWNDDDGQPHQYSLPRSILAGDGKEVRSILLDGGLFVSSTTRHRNALQNFMGAVRVDRRARAVSRVGWSDGCFALPDRTIGETDDTLVVYQGSAALDHEYRERGTLEDWQRRLASLGAGNSRIAIALSAAFVGPLLATLGEEGGGLHFRGKSSIGKSTALLAASSVWGPPSFVRQWRATQNGLEGLAEQSNETLLILDELAQLDVKEAGSVAYLLANGTGKARAAQTGEARAAKRWRVMFLSSGEISLSDHAKADGRGRRSAAGQEVRILDVEADAGAGNGLFDTVHGFPSAEAQARAIKTAAGECYGVAGPAFVERLVGKVDAATAALRTGIDSFVASALPPGCDGQVARGCRRFGLIAVAGETAARLGVLPWEQGVATSAAKVVFDSWLAARGGAGAAEDRAAIDQVKAFILAHGASRFQAMEDEGPMVIHNRIGFWRRGDEGRREYLIPSQSWRNEVCAGLNPKAVAALMAESGFLATDGAGKTSVPVALPGLGKTRCYIVLPALFDGGEDA